MSERGDGEKEGQSAKHSEKTEAVMGAVVGQGREVRFEPENMSQRQW
jgi:hypothetical protein